MSGETPSYKIVSLKSDIIPSSVKYLLQTDA